LIKNEQLSAPRRRTIAALLEQRDVRAAARAAKIGEATLHRWLAEPAFRAELYVAEGALIDAAVRRLLQNQDAAMSTILVIMADSTQPASVRLKAAVAVVDFMLKLRDLRNVEERLTALEARIAQRI